MVGRDLHDIFERDPVEPGETLLEVSNLCTPFLHGITFSLRRGEVLGVAGLIGSGKIELSRALFGADRITSGSVRLDGRDLKLKSPTDAIDAGIALLTEDRNHLGLALNMNARENMSLSSLKQLLRGPLIDAKREKVMAAQYVDQLMLKPPKSEMPVAHFSGGNRQKVILARWLNTNARLFIFNEPTAGIDVGAKHEIYRHMNRLAREGRGILCFSSDLMELLGVSDRIAVMCDGRVTGILDRTEATQEAIMTLATMFNRNEQQVRTA
jgi:ABC-type sugar transport system ATPase subunit